MDNHSQLRDRTIARGGQADPIDPYSIGRLVQTLEHNTEAISKMAENIQQLGAANNSLERTFSARMDKFESGLVHANNDIRTLTEKSVTMDAVDALLRSLGLDPVDALLHRKNQEFLTRRRHTLEERSGTKRHVRNAVAAAVTLALLLWLWNEALLPQIGRTVQKAQTHEQK